MDNGQRPGDELPDPHLVIATLALFAFFAKSLEARHPGTLDDFARYLDTISETRDTSFDPMTEGLIRSMSMILRKFLQELK